MISVPLLSIVLKLLLLHENCDRCSHDVFQIQALLQRSSSHSGKRAQSRGNLDSSTVHFIALLETITKEAVPLSQVAKAMKPNFALESTSKKYCKSITYSMSECTPCLSKSETVSSDLVQTHNISEEKASCTSSFQTRTSDTSWIS